LFCFSLLFLLFCLPSCKSCKKKEEPVASITDTASIPTPIHSINLPHADTTFIPILSAVLDGAFDASMRKDYKQLASYIIYRGPDTLKYGYDVFDAKNSFDKKIVKVTADVFNKWNNNLESRDYSRVFELPQGDGSSIPVMEVIFVTKKTVDRKFFLFQNIRDEWKIMEVTSYL
jgi:hypothetical protein